MTHNGSSIKHSNSERILSISVLFSTMQFFPNCRSPNTLVYMEATNHRFNDEASHVIYLARVHVCYFGRRSLKFTETRKLFREIIQSWQSSKK